MGVIRLLLVLNVHKAMGLLGVMETASGSTISVILRTLVNYSVLNFKFNSLKIKKIMPFQ